MDKYEQFSIYLSSVESSLRKSIDFYLQCWLILYYYYYQIQRLIHMQNHHTKIQPHSPQHKHIDHLSIAISSTKESHDDQDASTLYLTNSFQSTTKYSLNHLNSIFFQNGKIYNLLARNAEKKMVRCGCVKSFCQAKYCECYRSGQACGKDCICRGCKNTEDNVKNRVPEKSLSHLSLPLIPNSFMGPLSQPAVGCKCKKSGCSKKYCQCFQNGKKCGPSCGCLNCQNGRPGKQSSQIKQQNEGTSKQKKQRVNDIFQHERNSPELHKTKPIHKKKKNTKISSLDKKDLSLKQECRMEQESQGEFGLVKNFGDNEMQQENYINKFIATDDLPHSQNKAKNSKSKIQ